MDKRCKFLAKYSGGQKPRQLILVEYLSGSRAVLSLWIKGNNGFWQMEFDCPAYVGSSGVGRAAENDSKTPLGAFGMVCAFGIKPDPGAKLPYINVDEYTWCCGDAEHYNRIIDLRQHPHQCSGEHMADYAPEYNYGIFFDYNIEGTPGLGFAIFLHCMGDKPYTGGCVAVDEENMIRLVRAVDKDAKICIFK